MTEFDEFGDPGPFPTTEEFQAARLRVRRDDHCTSCGKHLDSEFLHDDQLDVFDGVLNNRLEPFHHGCEDF